MAPALRRVWHSLDIVRQSRSCLCVYVNESLNSLVVVKLLIGCVCRGREQTVADTRLGSINLRAFAASRYAHAHERAVEDKLNDRSRAPIGTNATEKVGPVTYASVTS